MKKLNWLTISSLVSLIFLVTVGTAVVVTRDVTLDHIGAGLILATAAVVSAILSLHLNGRS